MPHTPTTFIRELAAGKKNYLEPSDVIQIFQLFETQVCVLGPLVDDGFFFAKSVFAKKQIGDYGVLNPYGIENYGILNPNRPGVVVAPVANTQYYIIVHVAGNHYMSVQYTRPGTTQSSYTVEFEDPGDIIIDHSPLESNEDLEDLILEEAAGEATPLCDVREVDPGGPNSFYDCVYDALEEMLDRRNLHSLEVFVSRPGINLATHGIYDKGIFARNLRGKIATAIQPQLRLIVNDLCRINAGNPDRTAILEQFPPQFRSILDPVVPGYTACLNDASKNKLVGVLQTMIRAGTAPATQLEENETKRLLGIIGVYLDVRDVEVRPLKLVYRPNRITLFLFDNHFIRYSFETTPLAPSATSATSSSSSASSSGINSKSATLNAQMRKANKERQAAYKPKPTSFPFSTSSASSSSATNESPFILRQGYKSTTVQEISENVNYSPEYKPDYKEIQTLVSYWNTGATSKGVLTGSLYGQTLSDIISRLTESYSITKANLVTFRDALSKLPKKGGKRHTLRKRATHRRPTTRRH